jgi:hypothetical protein
MWFSASVREVLLPCFQHRPATRRHKGVTFTRVLLLNGSKTTALTWLDGFVNDEAAFPGMEFLGGGLSPYPYQSSWTGS